MPLQKRHPITRRLASASLVAAAVSFATGIRAAPAPVRLLTGFAPGASLDLLARLLAQELPGELGRPVVVENRTGASGRIANEALKNSAPDGATLLLAPIATLSIFPHAFGDRLRYDPFRDFVPVAHVARFQIAFAVGQNVAASSLREYVTLAKRDPLVCSFGSPAVGSIPHFLGLSLARMAGIELVHVPYRGAALAVGALAKGEIAAVASAASDLVTPASSGAARLLAIASKQRSPAMPQVPTFLESGYDLVGEGGYGMFLPAGTPADVVDQIGGATLRALTSNALRGRLESLGLELSGLGGTQLAAIVRADYERWGPTVRASGISLTD